MNIYINIKSENKKVEKKGILFLNDILRYSTFLDFFYFEQRFKIKRAYYVHIKLYYTSPPATYPVVNEF